MSETLTAAPTEATTGLLELVPGYHIYEFESRDPEGDYPEYRGTGAVYFHVDGGVMRGFAVYKCEATPWFWDTGTASCFQNGPVLMADLHRSLGQWGRTHLGQLRTFQVLRPLTLSQTRREYAELYARAKNSMRSNAAYRHPDHPMFKSLADRGLVSTQATRLYSDALQALRANVGYSVRSIIRALRRPSADTQIGGNTAYDVLGGEAANLAETLNQEVDGWGIARIPGRHITDRLSLEAERSAWYDHTTPPVASLDCSHYGAFGTEVVHCDGGTYCPDCAERELIRPVDDPETYYHQYEVSHWRGRWWRAFPPEYYAEREAGELLQNWSTPTSELHHDTTFTPSQFGDFTMGVELEVEVPADVVHDYAEEDGEGYYDEDDADDDSPAHRARIDAIGDCNKAFNAGPLGYYAMFKRDGSLSDGRGFEIVTAARRLGDHITQFKAWKPRNLEAWDAGVCGMHVHIDSRAFSALTLGKFLMFWNDRGNGKFLRGICGRHPDRDDQAESYARLIGQDLVVNPAAVKQGGNHSRYMAVNLTNLTHSERERLQCDAERHSKGDYSTVEIRLFRATLRKERLLAQLEFAHASVAFCRVASWQYLSEKAFLEWLAGTQAYPHLSRWYGSCVRNKKYTQPAQVASESAEV